ncbi:uncharacterized protein BCR38DRAFT_450627 [Pseudomassariella vexata]|uniref:Uncharacterized protein n=1 Tax=Pseudomassariella vexata TaxID=1141098 RepID=A0A1Y2DBE2_9PEZI|nr:uncharacterized protein BCR38DRAFT_450627 [Pseudomassariella vexata]ORY56580.1 hypothetical protein BCR38DRAFT_450627 [Pseudomassariella vexata]
MILEHEVEHGMKLGLGKAIVLPITEDTKGHGSHTIASLWKGYLEELLLKTEDKSNSWVSGMCVMDGIERLDISLDLDREHWRNNVL